MSTSATSRTAKNIIVKNLAVLPSPSLLLSKPNIFLFCVRSQLEFSAVSILKNPICDPVVYEILKKRFFWENARLYFPSKTFQVMNGSSRNRMKGLGNLHTSGIWFGKQKKTILTDGILLQILFESCCFTLDNPWKWESPRFSGI